MKTFISIVLSLMILVFSGCGRPDKVAGATAWEGGQSKESLAVEALTVSRGQLVNRISASGSVAGLNEALVTAETQGVIREVLFQLGERVREGQILLRVDDRLAKLNLERAKDQLDGARLELEATQKLFNSGGRAETELRRARSAESAARAQYEATLKALNDSTIRSPLSGLVASRDAGIAIGNLLNPGARVTRIVDSSAFKVEVSVGEREVGLIAAGAEADISVPAACADQVLKGSVRAVAAGSDPATGSFSVQVVWTNSCGERIRSGMSATVSIRSAAAAPVLVVPSAALLRREGKYGVFVDAGGTAQVREVGLGRRLGTRVEILSGLNQGDRLIMSALTRLRPGNPVSSTLKGESGVWE